MKLNLRDVKTLVKILPHLEHWVKILPHPEHWSQCEKKPKMATGLHDLPKDVLHLLFTRYCDPLTAVRCSRVCTKFRRAVGNTDKLTTLALAYRLRQEQSKLHQMATLRLDLLPVISNRQLPSVDGIPTRVPKVRCSSCHMHYPLVRGLEHMPEYCPMRVVLCKDCGTNMIQAKYKYQHSTTCPKRSLRRRPLPGTKAIKARMVLLQILLGIIKYVQVFVEFWIPDTFFGGVQRFFLAFFIVRIWFRL